MKRSPSAKRPAAKPAPRKRPPAKKRNWLAQLEAAELVRRVNEADPTFIFKHALTQETAYASLLHRTRRDIHLRVAETYEQLYPDQLDENAALLARHYAEGGNPVKALAYETRAGDTAWRIYANVEALEHYSRAIELAKKNSAMTDGSATLTPLKNLFLSRGRVLETSGRFRDALQNYAEMESLARERHDRPMELSALMAAAPIHAIPTAEYDSAEAKNISDRALALARELGDRGAEAKILWALLILTRWTGDPHDGIWFGEQSLAIAREQKLTEQIAFSLNDLGLHGYLDTSEFRTAHAYISEARELWRAQNNLPMLADSNSGVAVISYFMGHYDEVIAASDEARRISESIENLWGQSYARWIIGNVYADRGELARALQAMEEGIRLGDQAGFMGAAIGIRNQLAVVCAQQGLPTRALEIVARSMTLARSQFIAWLPWANAVQAYILAREGKIVEAEQAAQHARRTLIPFALENSMALFGVRLLQAEAEIALAKYGGACDAAMLDPLVEFLTRHDVFALLPDALLMQARMFLAQKNFDAALSSLQRAREIAERLTHRSGLWQIFGALADIETRRGNADAAMGFREKARAVVDYIAAHATEEQRAAFLNLPEVENILSG